MKHAASPSPFQILWTACIAFDAAWFADGPTDVAHLGALAAAGLALLRPLPGTFALAWASSIAAWFVTSPMTTNHGFTAMVGSALALALGAHRDDRRGVAGVMPLFVLAVYGAAVLQKLNTTYLFDTEASCAVALWRPYVDVPEALAAWLPGLSLVAELGIGLGLVFPRTRAAAAILGALFHVLVGGHPLSPIFLFSLTMTALYAASWPRGPAHLLPVARVCTAVGVAGSVFTLAGGGAEGRLTTWVAWLILTGAALICFARFRPDEVPAWRAARAPAGVAALLLPLLNTIPAHTGHRQFNSYDMYSNLEVDAAGTNHLFLPSLASARPASDRLRVVDGAPEDAVRGLVSTGDRVARVELVRLLRDGGIDRLSWTDATGRHEWSRGQPLPDEGISWWGLKTLRLRPEPSEPACVDCVLCR